MAPVTEKVWICISLFVVSAVCQRNYNCTGTSCGECTIQGSDCAWCKQLRFSIGDRCGTERQLVSRGCPSNMIIKRKTSRVTTLQGNPLDDGGEGKESVQLTPQHVKVLLVPNDIDYNNLTISYKVAKNFPLDLYILSDPSLSMQRFRQQLSTLAVSLSQEINRTTTDYRFGLGSSMDKVALPFSYTHPDRKQDPCITIPNQKCAPEYSFQHHYSLNRSVPGFVEAVKLVEDSANLDIPEGLFDGLMQAMVCGDKIGWRSKARRMLLFVTDGNYHMAGDGRLAGILPPNDGQCHLDASGRYTHANLQDYPSIGHLRHVATENNINIIFVIGGRSVQEITRVRNRYYEKLAEIFPGSNATTLSTEADNIIRIVSDNYKRLRETVVLDINNPDWQDKVHFFSKCYSDTKNNRRTCSGLTPDREVDFDIAMETSVRECPAQREQTFNILPQGLEDRVRVDIVWDCNCHCETPGQIDNSSIQCNKHGDLVCGVCYCHPGWTGTTCDCDESRSPMETCTVEGSKEICSGIGCCKCGRCMCNMTDCVRGTIKELSHISGEFCECDSTKCKIPPGKDEPCGGKEQGVCGCGTCVCKGSFYGDDCGCSDYYCTAPGNETVCSNNGVCDCNECRCTNETVVGKYVGQYCEQFRPQSTSSVCQEQTDCVLCKLFNEGLLSTTQCAERCTNVQVVDIIDATDVFCRIPTNDGCAVQVTYDVNGTISAMREKMNCPPNLVLIGIGILAAVVAVGMLLLLIWKILTMLYDHMEYAKFEKEINDPTWEKVENPIYKGCVTEVLNPEFEGAKNGMESDKKIK